MGARRRESARERVSVRGLSRRSARLGAACIAALAFAASACEPKEVPSNPMDGIDAGRVRRDGGPGPDAYRDDTGPPPDTGPRPDAYSEIDAAEVAEDDASTGIPITVNGSLSESFWDDAELYAASGTGAGIFDGMTIDRFLVRRTETGLFIGLEANFVSTTNVLVVYLDLGYGDGTGIVFSSAGLSDRSGDVDTVLSNALTPVDTDFRPDVAWGVESPPVPASSGSSVIGWRTLSQTGAFSTTGTSVTGQRSACSTTECETYLPISASTTFAFAVRVGDSATSDTWATGLTIPNDPDPEYVSIVETLAAP